MGVALLKPLEAAFKPFLSSRLCPESPSGSLPRRSWFGRALLEGEGREGLEKLLGHSLSSQGRPSPPVDLQLAVVVGLDYAGEAELLEAVRCFAVMAQKECRRPLRVDEVGPGYRG